MGRTKAKKKIPPMPKLGFADQMIYAMGYLLILAIFIGLYWFRFSWIDGRMLAQPGAAAYEPRGSMYCYFPFYLSLMLSLLIPWCGLHQKRYPFFGKRGVKYGPPAYPRTFPLFMKNKPRYWKSPSAARMRKATAIFVVVMNLVLLLLVPLSIYGRNMLYEDGTFRQYTVFDNVKREYAPEEAEEVTLNIGWHKTGRYSKSLRLTVYIDYGKHGYRFYHRSFGNDWVDDLTQVLSCFDRDIVRVGNIKELDVLKKGLSDANYDKLIALFAFYG